MKTKGLISAIAFLGILWSTSVPAQSTLTVPNGEYRLIAACRLQAIETSPPNNWVGQSPQFELFQFYPPIEDFLTFQTLLSGWAPAQPVFSEGEGGIFRSTGGDATLVFQPRTQTTLPLTLSAGFVLVCSQGNITASFEDIIGTSPVNGTMVYQFNQGPGRNPFNLSAPDYTIFTFANGAWSPTNPIVGIAEAVFVYQPPQLSNVQVTANGFSFEIMPPFSQQFLIEYTDSLTQPSWQPLTNIVGSGVSIKITDNSIGTSVQQRFYRARTGN